MAAVFSKATKRLLKNVIDHTNSHNKVVEETEMWQQHGRMRELGGLDPSNPSYGHDDRCDSRVSHRNDYWNSRTDRSAYRYRRAHMDDEREMKRNGSVETTSTYWMRQLEKQETSDPNRWGHSGYRELYPEDFNSNHSGSESDASYNSATDHHKRKKKSKRKRQKRHRSKSEKGRKEDRKSEHQHRKRQSREQFNQSESDSSTSSFAMDSHKHHTKPKEHHRLRDKFRTYSSSDSDSSSDSGCDRKLSGEKKNNKKRISQCTNSQSESSLSPDTKKRKKHKTAVKHSKGKSKRKHKKHKSKRDSFQGQKYKQAQENWQAV